MMTQRKALKTILLSYLLIATVISLPYGFFGDALLFLVLSLVQAIIGWKIIVSFVTIFALESYLSAFDYLLSLSSITLLRSFDMQGTLLVLTGVLVWGWFMMEYLIYRFMAKKLNLWKRVGIGEIR